MQCFWLDEWLLDDWFLWKPPSLVRWGPIRVWWAVWGRGPAAQRPRDFYYPKSLAASNFLRPAKQKPCDFCSGMVSSPLAATVVTAILRCDFCAAKVQTGISPEFRATWLSRRGNKKGNFQPFAAYFPVFGVKKGRKKTRTKTLVRTQVW